MKTKIGDKFNFLTIIGEEFRENKTTKVQCLCDCGKEVCISKQSVISSKTKSCGCYNRLAASKRMSDNNTKYSISIKHPLYQCWKSMKNRCTNISSPYYLKNIKIYQDWANNFESFYHWAISLWSQNLVLSRTDLTADFSPSNCYFRTKGDVVAKNQNKEKVKQTCLQKYGVEHYSQTEEAKTKLKDLCLLKYGVESRFLDKTIQQKIKNTNLAKYGNECPSKTEAIKEKVIKTNLKKYGVSHPSKTKIVIDKIKNTMIKNGHMYYFDDKSSAELADNIGISRSCMNARIRKYGYEIACSMDKRESEIEKLISIELDKLSISYNKQVKVDDKYADFVINNIVIEADGLYWHSDAVNKDKNYHKNKRLMYLKNGLIPLFFREHEIINKRDIVLSIIKNKLKINSVKFYARKTKVVDVSFDVGKKFFEENHLMGVGVGKIVGLEINNELVSCLQITNKSEYYDVSRFANKINTTVVGGFSKLLSLFSDKTIKTFIDRRYGLGDYLLDLGFKLQHEHLSFSWVRNDRVFHRMKFSGNSGYENKCYKMWDCGQALYVKEYINVFNK